MAFSYRNILFTIVLMLVTIFIACPQSGVGCRPLLLHSEWSNQYGLLWQLLANGPAPVSDGDHTHP
ncbi:unnamed protein product [Lathyrus oleraceus]